MIRATELKASEAQARDPWVSRSRGALDMQGTISVGEGPFAGLIPLSRDYAVVPIEQAFNWNECLASVERGEWYVVAFRSVRRPGSDDAALEEFDRRAFAEASLQSGLLCYFIGELDAERRCLSMCVWEDRARAGEAATLPDHTAAIGIARETYTSYVLERHHLTKRDGSVELVEIEPPQPSPAVDDSPRVARRRRGYFETDSV